MPASTAASWGIGSEPFCRGARKYRWPVSIDTGCGWNTEELNKSINKRTDDRYRGSVCLCVCNCLQSTQYSHTLFGCLCIKDCGGRDRCWQGERSTCISFGVLSTRTAVPLSILIRLILLPWLFLTSASFRYDRRLFHSLPFVNNICRSLAKLGLRCARVSVNFAAPL